MLLSGTADQITMPWLINQYASRAGVLLEGMSTDSVLPNNFTHLPHGDYVRLARRILQMRGFQSCVCVHSIRPRIT